MNIRATAVAVAVAAASVAATPVTNEGIEPTCHAGMQLVTTEGFELTFDAPYATAPELAATGDVTGNGISRQRSAHFDLAPWVAPADEADVTFELSWSNPGDYDLFLYDAEGFELARSAESNIDEGTNGEQIRIGLDHCQPVQLRVASWVGQGAEQLTLEVTVEADGAAAAAPAQRIFFLGGDRPGQLAMAGGAPTNLDHEGYPLQGTVGEQRPTGGIPNHYTRPVVGFNDPGNLLLPSWQSDLEEPLEGTVNASALVWVSSQTQGEGGTLTVDLLLEFGAAVRVEVPGELVGDTPTPILVDFGPVDVDGALNVGLQVGTDPTIASDGGSQNAADAEHTVWYDSVQFPSRLILTAG